MICTCMQFAPAEMLKMWRRRAAPTVRRLLVHGHAVRHKHMAETVRLICMVERGGEEVTSVANWNRSHHLRDCPFNPCNTPLNQRLTDTVSMAAT